MNQMTPTNLIYRNEGRSKNAPALSVEATPHPPAAALRDHIFSQCTQVRQRRSVVGLHSVIRRLRGGESVVGGRIDQTSLGFASHSLLSFDYVQPPFPASLHLIAVVCDRRCGPGLGVQKNSEGPPANFCMLFPQANRALLS